MEKYKYRIAYTVVANLLIEELSLIAIGNNKFTFPIIIGIKCIKTITNK